MRITGMPRRWPRIAAVAAIAAVAVSLASGVYLHLTAARVSPLADTVSSYVHADGGRELLAVAALSLAVGFTVLLSGLAAVGVRLDPASRALALAWGLSLVLIVWFPADVPGPTSTFSGVVHNWAGGSVFVCLPLAGWRMSAALTGAWQSAVAPLRVLAAGAGAALVIFVVTHPPVNRWYGGAALHGLAERILLGLQVSLLLVLATRLLRVSHVPPAVVAEREQLSGGPLAEAASGVPAPAGVWHERNDLPQRAGVVG